MQIEILSIAVLLFFVLFFLGVLIRVRNKRPEYDRLAHLPLEDNHRG